MMQGSCLCGAVTFEVDPPLRDVVACHCTSCRKQSGHYWAASSAPKAQFRLTRDEGLEWFSTSSKARRGFCRNCGSFLLWDPADEERISFAAGALDGPTGLHIASHIYKDEAGDYYSPEGPPPAPGMAPDRLHASCLCGANRFSMPGPAGAVGACHCTQCRKFSGHYTASFDADEAGVEWQAQLLDEYPLPGGARQAHCRTCGCRLYFRRKDGAFSVEAGIIDGPTGGRLESHIFVAWKGDYYTIDDGLPQFQEYD